MYEYEVYALNTKLEIQRTLEHRSEEGWRLHTMTEGDGPPLYTLVLERIKPEESVERDHIAMRG